MNTLRLGSPTCPSVAYTLVLPMRNVQTWQTVSTRLDLLNFLIDMQIATQISRIPFVPLIVATVSHRPATHQPGG
jgi:hypothetical protein